MNLSGYIFSLCVLVPRMAWSDPVPVKVCVTVAGDADEVVRASAETVADAVAQHAGFRGVADRDARAALRGDSVTSQDFVDVATARRSLHGEDRDATALDGVATRLGCGLVVELVARPAVTLVRVYDPVRHMWPASREMTTVDGGVVDGVLVPAVASRETSATTTTRQIGVPSNANANASRVIGATQPSSQSSLTRLWPWAVVGGVAIAAVAIYFATTGGDTPATTRITVIHRGL
jgi:hypothetical protein